MSICRACGLEKIPKRDTDELYCKYCLEEIGRISFPERRCIYCGDHAQALDGYAPLEVRDRELPICMDCNWASGFNVFKTVDQKAAHILFLYKAKYRQAFGAGYSAEDLKKEYGEYGYALLTHLQHNITERTYLLDRLRWLKGQAPEKL